MQGAHLAHRDMGCTTKRAAAAPVADPRGPLGGPSSTGAAAAAMHPTRGGNSFTASFAWGSKPGPQPSLPCGYCSTIPPLAKESLLPCFAAFSCCKGPRLTYFTAHPLL